MICQGAAYGATLGQQTASFARKMQAANLALMLHDCDRSLPGLERAVSSR
jgi:hypothetical protein